MNLPAKTDVLIIGAGPAGSTLAFELARRGIEVLLLDKARFPRGKTCAGGVNVRAIRLFPFDLAPVTEETITGILFTRNLEKSFLRRYPEPLMVTVSRENFDQFLAGQARQAGARILEETKFLNLLEGKNSLEVQTSRGTVMAQFVVGADGARSSVARKLGLMEKTPHILAIHSEIPSSFLPWPERDVVQIDWGSLKRSYAYLFPKKNFFSVGVGGFGLPPARIKDYQRTFLATRWQNEKNPCCSTAGFLLPLRHQREPIQKGRSLLLGDAAGLIDPFTGEGIYCAVRSAQLAAPILAQAHNEGWDSLDPYQEKIDRELMPELEWSRFLRELFNLRPSYFHRKIATSDRWWRAMAKLLRGDVTYLDLKRKLGLLGSLLLRMSR